MNKNLSAGFFFFFSFFQHDSIYLCCKINASTAEGTGSAASLQQEAGLFVTSIPVGEERLAGGLVVAGCWSQ